MASGLGVALRGRRPREIGFVSVLPNPPKSFLHYKPKIFNTEDTEKSGDIRLAVAPAMGASVTSVEFLRVLCGKAFSLLERGSLQVGAHDLDQIVRGFFRGFCFPRHVVADVVLHQFAHEAVDGAARGGEALQDLGAGLVLIQGAPDGFELPHNFLGAGDQIQLFSR